MSVDPGPDFFEQEYLRTIERIERFGYTATVVGTGQCSVPGCDCEPEPYPYAYSLGFCEHDHPELLAFGVPFAHVNDLMDPVFAAVRSGRPLTVGREPRHALGGGLVVSLLPVPDRWVRRDPGRIGQWIDVYGPPLPSFVQIVWSDRHGRLPWDDGCAPSIAAAQPILADDPVRYPEPPRNRARHRRTRPRR